MTAKLTPKQAMFVKEYLVDLNATQAAIRAGYSAKTASEQGTRLLGNVKIQAALGEIQQARGNRLEVTADRIEKELAKIAFAKVNGAVEWDALTAKLKSSDELPDEVLATIQEISQTAHGIKIKQYDKLKALELLGRRHGMFVDKVEHSGTIKNKNLSEVELDKRIAELTKKLS